MEPASFEDELGVIKKSAIAVYGDTIHTFVERRNYRGLFMPGYRRVATDTLARPVGLKYVDHCVGNELGDERLGRFLRQRDGFSALPAFR